MSRKQTKADIEKEKQQDKGPQTGGAIRGAAGGKIRFDSDTGKLLVRLFSFFERKYVIRLCIVALCVIAAALISVRSSMFLGEVIDNCIKPMLIQSVPDFGPLKTAMVKMAGLYALSVVAILTRQLLMVGVSNGLLYKIRMTLFGHLQTLPIGYFDTHPYGDTMSRFTNDIDNIRQLVSQSLTEVFSSTISIITVFAAMLSLSWRLTLVVILTIVVIYFVSIGVGGASSKNFTLRQTSLGLINAFIEENLNGQKVVQVFCHEDKIKKEFDEKNEDLRRKSVTANSLAGILMPINASLGNIQYVILAVVGGYFAINGNGSLTLGMLASFLTLSRNFTRPVTMISQQVNSLVMALAGARRIFRVLDEKPEEDEGYVTLVPAEEKEDGSLTETDHVTGTWAWKYPHKTSGVLEYIKVRGDVRFFDVDFSYTPEKQILYDVSLFAKPGQKIAFVGSTGAGKTTITNLINRFYDIEDGKIRFDGININKIKKSDLRHAMGIVLQDTNLFTGTVAENIKYGKLDATYDEVVQAAKIANAHNFIMKLPQGYDTVISGTGSQLSQGQCQLLAIARAAIEDAPVMILDEATSSIDTRTETLIQQGMDRLMSGRTTFVIAHRLSTVQNANAIMVVEGGRIIERGTHEELLELKGRYYQLYTGNTN
ncbi:MAG: ABC transporter ATP-binding protein [Firmicutes bacterium]|nr:ABC transporter ATP-binding protein [Bacillota bacterium]